MPKVPENPQASTCPACGTSFVCGAAAGLASCWCMEKAPLSLAPEAGGSCFCPTCLTQRFSAEPGKPFPAA
ncbi:MAG: cysteine-rich CWC family protein [Candidatus Accumulibacter sp.]|uniref:cysteine-rich CWC family protein n=1 Tax=unclassified Candidatus Accumulibacter TaxID=2619054 RepID=UPI0012D18D9D|nr:MULTISPECIES: cysteine-rich CWC family protein [unclassified Candidatus Accumulibacter]MQM33343.1 hypothetical protein [Candidatus Accumulibacter phosphatis]MBL8368355.1 cysteine-rich CWC family protein [Accumulibacter sp.]MBN8514781.1 cysteine-rich CWC family protein [Accumulibacter sp.]MBO3702822.1 cysteine-rich CWC family protein [Accumulibacter sp.]HRE70478.1 cysteine-rich CWC family protein [Accumulibacter sp.]